MPAPEYAIDAVQTPLNAQLDTWHVAAAPPLTITYAFEAQQSAGTTTSKSRMCASAALVNTQPSPAMPVTITRCTPSCDNSTSSGVAKKAECLGLSTR